MNEELIRRCAREWAAQDRERVASLMRTREAEADELTAADRYRRGVNDALLTREFELLRLYHARAVAPLVEAGEKLGGWLSAAMDDPKVSDAMKADVQFFFSTLAPFQQEADSPAFDPEDYCERCGNGDKVPASGYWRCPKCDAEWPGEA